MNDIKLNFRILSSLGMFFVLCGHYGSGVFSFDGLFAYDSFHIPLFVFISGYFFSDKYCTSFKSILSFLKKKFLRLLVPYYIWNILYFVFGFILSQYSDLSYLPKEFSLNKIIFEPFQLAGGFSFNLASWFLMALFLTSLFYLIFRITIRTLLFKYTDFILLLIFIVFAYKAVYISHSNWLSEWKISICRTLYLLFYYHLGFLYKIYLEKLYSKIDSFQMCVLWGG